jgi:LysM repeat protein
MARRFTLITLIAVLLIAAAPFSASAQDAAAAGRTCTRYHTVVRGDTLVRLARTYGTTIAQLQMINRMGTNTRIFTGTTLCVVAGTGIPTTPNTYIVRTGDTLVRIARSYGIHWRVLAQVNNLSDPNRITVGMRLTIPDVTIQTS